MVILNKETWLLDLEDLEMIIYVPKPVLCAYLYTRERREEAVVNTGRDESLHTEAHENLDNTVMLHC